MTITGFEDLKSFILDPQRMRMSHLYKPLMIIAVVRSGGAASREDIASEFVRRDVFQLEHYRRRVVDPMPGDRLVRDGILVREGDTYRLAPAFQQLRRSEQMELIAACERRIEHFVEQRGDPFAGRNLESIPIGARYEVLKRAGGRCELCGVSHEEVPLEVDHILPRAQGGSNDIGNLQALCRSCNSDKRHLDDTDFREVRASFGIRQSGCVFCQAESSSRVIGEDELAFVIADRFPVTEGHSLIIPRRHVSDYFGLHQSEKNAVDRLLRNRREHILAQDERVKGFNLGVNIGETAGQTVFHVHIHLIPRRPGDIADPRGGIRRVIPDWQTY